MGTEGYTAPGFEAVRDAFEQNLTTGRDVGASFAAYHQGEKVVDLWGGVADPETGRTWDQHTMAIVFSTTKGATAICAHKLAQEGKLDLDAPVAKYWPEFAAAGKGDIPVTYLLSHQAGLAWVDTPLSVEELLAWDPIVEALAAQKPHWEPGTAQGYHALTYGNLVGEVVRRVDGRTLGTYFREEIAEPLGLDFWIGLPEEHEPRVARLVGPMTEMNEVDENVRAMVDQFMGPETMLGKSLSAGADIGDLSIFNTRAMHAAEIPAAGGIANANGVARMYAAVIGEVDGIRLITPEQLERATKQVTQGPNIVILNLDLQFGLGFFVPSSLITLGGPKSFGHFGLGGSVGWADPEAGFAFGYVMNKLDMALVGDVRSTSLVDACYAAIA